MTVKARIVGPEAELGDVRGGLAFFGHTLTREWSKIDPTDETLSKLRANRFVDLSGDKDPLDHDNDGRKGGSKPSDETAATKARLDELGVSYAKDASAATLRDLLTKAEEAQAAAEKEAEEAQADADRAAAGAAGPGQE